MCILTKGRSLQCIFLEELRFLLVESISLCTYSSLNKSNPKNYISLILTEDFFHSTARYFLYNAFQGDAQ